MRAKGANVQQVLLALALLAGVFWNLARAAELRSVDLRTGATGTRAELRLDQTTAYQLISLSAPERLVVDLKGVRQVRALSLPAASGLVRGVRSGQPAPGTLRIVFDLAGAVVPLKPHFEPGPDGTRLVLEWPDDAAPRDTPATTTAAAPANPATGPLLASSASVPAGSGAPGADTAVRSPQNPGPAAAIGTAASTSIPPRAVPSPGAAATVGPSGAVVAAQPPVKTVEDIARRAGMRPLVIAIDAGHGGQDPGAHGVAGTREKDITLQVARELARQVNATPGLKAYLTRDTDVFIPLVQRYQKARAAKADLFVSIHADSYSSPSASGSSVFVLSQRGASSQAARWLAKQENAADLVGGVKLQDKDDTLASVLLDLSQSATMKASEDMASQVLDGLRRLGPMHKGEVERANFVVLRSPDVPSMLVETAFISNPDEERRLRDPQHQGQLARAILDGVTSYFTRQPPPGTLYAARAEAGGAPAVAGGAGGGSR